MKLEQIIASSCRQKMLLALYKTRTTHVTNLVRIMNSTYNQVDRNLQILEKEGIIKTTYYGHVRMIELMTENPKTQAILKALHSLSRPILNYKNRRAPPLATVHQTPNKAESNDPIRSGGHIRSLIG